MKDNERTASWDFVTLFPLFKIVDLENKRAGSAPPGIDIHSGSTWKLHRTRLVSGISAPQKEHNIKTHLVPEHTFPLLTASCGTGEGLRRDYRNYKSKVAKKNKNKIASRSQNSSQQRKPNYCVCILPLPASWFIGWEGILYTPSNARKIIQKSVCLIKRYNKMWKPYLH